MNTDLYKTFIDNFRNYFSQTGTYLSLKREIEGENIQYYLIAPRYDKAHKYSPAKNNLDNFLHELELSLISKNNLEIILNDEDDNGLNQELAQLYFSLNYNDDNKPNNLFKHLFSNEKINYFIHHFQNKDINTQLLTHFLMSLNHRELLNEKNGLVHLAQGINKLKLSAQDKSEVILHFIDLKTKNQPDKIEPFKNIVTIGRLFFNSPQELNKFVMQCEHIFNTSFELEKQNPFKISEYVTLVYPLKHDFFAFHYASLSEFSKFEDFTFSLDYLFKEKSALIKKLNIHTINIENNKLMVELEPNHVIENNVLKQNNAQLLEKLIVHLSTHYDSSQHLSMSKQQILASALHAFVLDQTLAQSNTQTRPKIKI